MGPLPHRLDRTVLIQATPETVFGFFTDSARWAKWWGAGSTIDARPGGKVLIRHPNAVEALGEVLEVSPPERIVFTYGFSTGTPIPPGASRVTIRLEPAAAGTRLHLAHEFAEADAVARDQHIQGWRFQLSLFSNAVANEVFADAATIVDRWFDAWAIPADADRDAAFARIATPGIFFRDRYSALEGVGEISAHAGAAQRYMPGVRLSRTGEIRHCQGTVLADWTAGAMSGTSVFDFAADGRLRSVTGLTNPPR